MPRFITMIAVLFAVGCANNAPDASTEAPPIAEVLAAEGRLPADLERDARSRPDIVIPMLALAPGDRVADIFGGAGYYSEILAGVVGAEGEVLLHNNAAYARFAGPGLARRFDGRSFEAITRLTTEASDLGLGRETLDAAIIIMSYHDLFVVDPENGWPAIDAENFVGQIHRALKPGGRFLIVDHVATAGSGKRAPQNVHRIDPEFARAKIEAQGFTFARESDALSNPADDYTLNVFDPAIRGRTDRFIHVYLK